MKLIFSHPTGNSNVRAAVQAFNRNKMLYGFYTSLATFQNSLTYQLGGIGLFKEIRRRMYDESLKENTHTYPFYEIGRVLSSKLGWKKLIEHQTGIFSVESVYASLDKRVASRLASASKRGLTSVYAYEDGALNTFLAAKRMGLKCFYDLPIGYWRAGQVLLGEEAAARPLWADTLGTFRDSEHKLQRKDKELELSDSILVASSFTAKTLEYYPGELPQVHVIPYGFPTPVENREYRPLDNRKLKLLFVGGLSQRKGIGILLEVVSQLSKDVELTIVGRKPTDNCEALNAGLSKHKWIESLPHADILNLMREHDVLVFPSLFEGFGLVITEAMSQGTPVITTDRTAGPDLINSGENGWIIESGSTSALRSQIESLLDDPTQIEQAGFGAIQRAKSWSWYDYGEKLVATITNEK